MTYNLVIFGCMHIQMWVEGLTAQRIQRDWVARLYGQFVRLYRKNFYLNQVRPHDKEDRARSRCRSSRRSAVLSTLCAAARRIPTVQEHVAGFWHGADYLLGTRLSEPAMVVVHSSRIQSRSRLCSLAPQPPGRGTCISAGSHRVNRAAMGNVLPSTHDPRLRPNNSSKPTPLRGAA
jgi:hypothetical protein